MHSSDLHLDSPPGPAPDAPAGLALAAPAASRRAVVRLVDLALQERADLLVISGDVFDREADTADAGRFFAAQMSRLAHVGVPVLVAAGNHDAVCPRATRHPGSVRWFPTGAAATHVFDRLGVAVHGQGLADPAEPGDLAAGFPAPLPGYLNLGVLHTSLDGRLSRAVCAPTSVSRLTAKGYAYWALGHVHQRRVVAVTPWVVYPGSPHGQWPGEPGSPGATVITTTAGAVTGVEHRELALLAWPQTHLDRGGRPLQRSGSGARG